MIQDTPRLRLRPWREADRAPLAAIHGDPTVMRHFPAVLGRAESDAFIDRMMAHRQAHGFAFAAVEHRATATLIGAVGLLTIPWVARFTPAVEIGWRIATPYQRQGFALEAAAAALAHGFGRLGLETVVAFTVPANLPSQALMLRLGFVPDGGFEHPQLPAGHKLRPHLLFRLTRAMWSAQGGFVAAVDGGGDRPVLRGTVPRARIADQSSPADPDVL